MEVTKIHNVSVLHLFGEISILEMQRVERMLIALRESDHHHVLIDMGSVDHVHYRVMKHLIDSALAFRRTRGDIKLAHVNAETKTVMQFTGADQYLEDYATLSEAILSFLQRADNGTVYQ